MSDNALKNKDSFRRLDALTVATVAEAKALDVPVGAVVETQGELTATDGGWKRYVVVANGTGSNTTLFVNMDNGNQLRLLSGNLISDLTVNIPTDYADLQSAIDDLSGRLDVNQGVIIDLMIEAGHQPSSGVYVRNGNYSKFQISSVDAEVILPSSFSGDFINAEYAHAPTLNCFVDANFFATQIVSASNFSDVTVNSGKGGKRPAYRGLYVNTQSRAFASGSVFTDATNDPNGRNVWVTRNSKAYINNGDFSRANFYNVYASRVSDIYGEGITIDGANEYCLYSTRTSRIVCHNSSLLNCANTLRATGDSKIFINGSTVSGLTGEFAAAVQSSSVSVMDCDVTGNGGSTSIYCDEGGSAICNRLVTNDMGGIFARGGAIVSGRDVSLSGNSIGDGIRAESATVYTPSISLSGFADGVNASNNSNVSAENCSITNSTGSGIRSSSSRVELIGGSVTGSSVDDLAVIWGGQIIAIGAETSSLAGSVTLADTNLNSLNVIESNKGIIWS